VCNWDKSATSVYLTLEQCLLSVCLTIICYRFLFY